jgi:hypothetical protein
MNKKILITGTGRCGTTFLVKLLMYLEFDTGFKPENYSNSVFAECNSGMERSVNHCYRIIKDPKLLPNMENVIKTVPVEMVIIPVRDFSSSAQSRVNLGRKPGGLWRANNKNEQIYFYQAIMAGYITIMTKYNIPTTFLDFHHMTTDARYLFEKLGWLMQEKNISFELFREAYDKATETSKPKPV